MARTKTTRKSRKAAPPPAPAKKPILPVAGDTGLNRSGGRIFEEYLPELRGQRGMRVYQQMIDSPLYGAFFRLCDTIIRQVTFTVGGEDRELASELDRQIKTLAGGWRNILSESAVYGALPFGYAVHEIVWTIRDGRFEIEDLEPRAQTSVSEWIYVGRKPKAIRQDTVVGTFVVPLEKCLHVILTPNKRSPEGKSCQRAGYRNWFIGREIEDFESIGVERDNVGLMVMELPTRIMSATNENDPIAVRTREDYKDKLKKLRRNQLEGVVIPAEIEDGKQTGFKLRTVQAAGSTRINQDQAVRRHESRALISLLCEFLLQGQDAAIPVATHSGKKDIILASIRGMLDSWIEMFQLQVVRRWMELNAYTGRPEPTIEYGDLEEVSLTDLASFLQSAVSFGGITPDRPLEEWLRTRAGAPDMEVAPPVSVAPTNLPSPPPNGA